MEDDGDQAAKPLLSLVVRDHDRRAGCFVRGDVRSLVTAGVGIWDQDHGYTDGANLAQRAGAGPADHKVGTADSIGQLTDKGERLVAGRTPGGRAAPVGAP